MPAYSKFADKPYPLGRCREIRDKVFEILKAELKQSTSPGLIALKDYMQLGHPMKKIWGGLKGLYFQNALQVGDYYIDVANDTVNPNKPRVEILLMKNSGFSAIKDFEHFIKIAENYWQVKIYKNSVCSSLAPMMPLLCVDKHQKSWLAANDNMIELAQKDSFKNAQRILKQLDEVDNHIKAKWQAVLNVAADPNLNNSKSPIEYCQLYRDKKLAQDTDFRNQLVSAFMKINKPI